MTAAHELILVDVLLIDEDRLLAVELLRYDKEVLLLRFLLFLLTHKGHIFAPADAVVAHLILTVQFVDILLAQEYDLLS